MTRIKTLATLTIVLRIKAVQIIKEKSSAPFFSEPFGTTQVPLPLIEGKNKTGGILQKRKVKSRNERSELRICRDGSSLDEMLGAY